MDWRDKVRIFSTLHLLVFRCSFFICMLYIVCMARGGQSLARKNRRPKRYSLIDRMDQHSKHMEKLVKHSDADCITNLRMDRRAFYKLCYLLQHSGGIRNEKYVTVDEQVAMFLSVLAHSGKNRRVGLDFKRSGHTVSIYFNKTLNALLRIYKLLQPKPEPVTSGEESDTWKWFKGCLGALDGTYIKVTVSMIDKPRYITRKGETAVNVLGVCDRNMKFTYILSGWEGSASDSMVLRSAVTSKTGLKVPAGSYYLCDSSYPNEEGFLTPYRGKRYHSKNWEKDLALPKDYQEYFNMKHWKARNVIKRAFSLLKKRWSILSSSMKYPIKVQNRIIMACTLLENFIRMQMPVDPLEDELEDNVEDADDMDEEFVGFEDSSSAWSNWRDNLAQDMFNAWRANQ